MEIDIGSRLKSFREEKGLSIYALSKECGLTRSFIGKVEKGQTSPSISSLKRITSALNISLNQLFENQDHTPRVKCTRVHERRVFVNPPSKVTYEFLFPNPQSRRMDAYFIRVKPGGKSDYYKHEGEECGSVLQGILKLTIQDEEHVLHPGDSIYFQSSLPHKWENISKEEVLAFWVVTPPSF